VLERGQQIHQAQIALAVTQAADLLVADEQGVEHAEHVADGFTVEDAIHRALRHARGQRSWQRDDETEPVDPGDRAVLFADEQTAAIPFLLHPIGRIGNEPFDRKRPRERHYLSEPYSS